ncbi:MSMEG_0570 family nitrogen starvation response protein [Nevskia sp.]|uniref:MSMEG_0570 family nitrogen starvation response protein n=1 Tax=Nevskia sp. TaxID=1929292 RepID=UPI0025F1F2F4|nr:MSMEG_0570 family nitrogen starvation response protein [Nevskia sp.]
MPEVHFRVRWPDHTATRCYSPSATIRSSLQAGLTCPVAQFVKISRMALEKGSERVRRKHGFACGRAEMQIAIIESFAARYASQPDAQVTIEAYED